MASGRFLARKRLVRDSLVEEPGHQTEGSARFGKLEVIPGVGRDSQTTSCASSSARSRARWKIVVLLSGKWRVLVTSKVGGTSCKSAKIGGPLDPELGAHSRRCGLLALW